MLMYRDHLYSSHLVCWSTECSVCELSGVNGSGFEEKTLAVYVIPKNQLYTHRIGDTFHIQ